MNLEAKAKLLYVEDDESLSYVTQDNLEVAGYEVISIDHGSVASKKIEEGIDFDLAILDIMLPGVDGFTLAEQIRSKYPQVPIMFLSAKSLKEDRLRGLRIGADDYLTKPFSIEELILKVEIFLRRRHFAAKPSEETILGIFKVDSANLELINGENDESKRRLTQRELSLLLLLLKNKNQVIKRSEILIAIWGRDDYFLGRSMDVFISRLRKYLKADPNVSIENVHGVGFRLNAPS